MGNFNLSRLALKIVVMTREQGTGNREQGTGNREQGTGNRFSATLLFVTYVGFFPFTYLSKSYFFTEIKSIHNY
jgi:hypothetical protein